MSTFLFVRFVLHVRSEGPHEGILEWGKEMKRGLYGPALSSTPPSPPSSSHHHKDHHHQQQQQQQHVQFDPDVTLGPQAQDHEIRESDGGGGVAILDGRNHTKPGHKQHKNQHPYPRRLHQDHHHHHTIKGGHQSPGLSSGSSSSSSTSDDDDGEGEENDRSTLGSTVVVERVSEGEGKVMGGSIVEDSPIMVKTEIGIR